MSERSKVLELFDEQSELVKKRVNDGIERYRKGDARITVTDANGKAVPNAEISLEQSSHDFRFGANLFMLDGMETEEKNEKYKKFFADVFNMATLPFYWDTLEPQKGNPRYGKNSESIYRRPAIDPCIEFCEANGIEPREHALAYDHFFPSWLHGESTETVKKELERRYSEISERYADKIRTIEVTNEMEWQRKDAVSDFYNEPDFVEWCFKLAEKYFPNNQLGINEHGGLAWGDCCRATDKYYSYIEANMLKGARIDAIGMQYHLFVFRENEYRDTRILLDPKSMYDHMDMYAQFGKPLQITEVTVPSYSWEPEDEEIQAKIIEKIYQIWFSHPNVEQIIYWNLVDGYAYVNSSDPEEIRKSQGNMTLGENYFHGGLLRFDLSPKPAYHKIKELTQKVWHTSVRTATDVNGNASFRGFFGGYNVEIIANGQKYTKNIHISRNSDNEIKITI